MANSKTTKKTTKKSTTKSTSKPKVEKKPVKRETVKKEVIKEEPKKVEVKEEKKCPKMKFILLGSIIAGVIIIAVLVILCITVFFNKERIITRKVKAMGVDYYTNYLYDTLAKNREKKDLDKILSRYASVGIKLNLNTLEKYDSGKYAEEIKTLKTKKKECDKANTKVTIYPVEPYNKTDYNVVIELDCGF